LVWFFQTTLSPYWDFLMDDIDHANIRDEVLLAAQVSARKPTGPKPTGFCLWCEEPLADTTHRWCDASCRDDYELAAQNAPHLIP
jgi:hypothetical protein